MFLSLPPHPGRMVKFLRSTKPSSGRAGGRRPRRAVASRRYSIVIADRTSGVVRRFTLPLGPTLTTTSIALALAGPDRARRALERVGSDRRPDGDQRRADGRERKLSRSHRPAGLADLGAADGGRRDRRTRGGRSRGQPRDGKAARDRQVARDGRRRRRRRVIGSALGPADAAFGVLRDLLGAIEHRLDSVRTGVERRQALAAATPSIWPVAGWLSSAFGNRRDPFTGGSDFHPGLDISADYGQPVLATARRHGHHGRLRTAAYGNMVVARPRLRHRHEVRPPVALRGDGRPAGQPRRRHRLRRIDRPLDQLAPALRDLDERQAAPNPIDASSPPRQSTFRVRIRATPIDRRFRDRALVPIDRIPDQDPPR